MDRIMGIHDLVNLNIPNKEQVADEILSLPEDDLVLDQVSRSMDV